MNPEPAAQCIVDQHWARKRGWKLMRIDEAMLLTGGYERFDRRNDSMDWAHVRRVFATPQQRSQFAGVRLKHARLATVGLAVSAFSCATTLQKPLTLGRPSELQKPQRRWMSACLRASISSPVMSVLPRRRLRTVLLIVTLSNISGSP